MHRRIALPLLLLAVGLAGCIEDETITRPPIDETSQLFQRYVALGNSLTAGYMSGGINDSTQRLAYPVLLARRADAGFAIPSLAMPGCPPPLVGVLDTTAAGDVVIDTDRVGGGTSGTCGLRQQPVPDIVQNLAVPGAKMADALDIRREGNASNTLTTLILGGMSQVEAARQAAPTLVSMWLGNNDVLGGALAGEPALMTPVDTFEFYAQRVIQGIAGAQPQTAVVIGIIDVTLAPVLQPGLYFWVADSLGFAPKPVNANCAPTDSLGERNPQSMNTVSWLAFTNPDLPEVSCADDAPFVLTPDEVVTVQERVGAFNDYLRAEANQRDWVYVSSTGVLNAALLGSQARNRVRQCSGLDNDMSLEAIVSRVQAYCPHESAPNFFGSFLTYDGTHISGEAHQVVADAIASALNSEVGAGL